MRGFLQAPFLNEAPGGVHRTAGILRGKFDVRSIGGFIELGIALPELWWFDVAGMVSTFLK